MSDISSPESATASLTAVSAWAASGSSAERVTWEKPTPLTATLHRFSHMSPLPSSSRTSIVRPSRQPLRGFLRMRFFLMLSKKYLILRRRAAPSRRTQDVCAAHHLPIHSQALRTQGAAMDMDMLPSGFLED